MTRFTTTGGCKLLLLLLMVGCASAPKHEALNSFSDSHPDCQIKSDDLKLPLIKSTGQTFSRSIKTTTSIMATTVGYATDVVIVGGTIVGLAYLCQYGCSSLDIPIFDSYTGVGNWTYKETSSWRCPYVDHISEAVRKSAKCNYEHGNYVEAYEELNFLDHNKVMKDCLSHLEVEKVDNLRNSFTSTGGSE